MFKFTALFSATLFVAANVHAQSSVVIFGIVDLGIAKSNGGGAANPGGNGSSSAWMVKQAASSRLGFRGTEDLGDGLTADFMLDHRFTPDDGVAGNPFWSGRSLLQLNSPSFGSIYLGRDYSPAFWLALFTDPFVWEGVGQLGLSQYAGFLDTGGVRTNNTVGYLSPSVAGATLRVATSLGEGATGRDDGLNVEYKDGKLYAAAGYQKISGGPALSAGNSLVNLALTYDFSLVKPMLYFSKSKTNGGALATTFFSVGATAFIGLGRVKLAYSRTHPSGLSSNQQKFSIGYDYYLSKRTNLYADVGLGRQDLVSGNSAYGLGIRHTF